MRGPVRLPLEELQPYLCDISEGTLVWSKVFGNDAPVEIEVGFGKGLFLLNESQTRPEVNFFGIEVERKYVLFTANRLAKRRLGNVRLIDGDGRLILCNRVASRSVQAIHVYFPDPWWKKRHHKRRLFTADFVEACVNALKDGGRLEVASDVDEYFAIITTLLAKQSRLHAATGQLPEVANRTNFERKYRLAGKPIFAASYEVRGE